MHRSHKKRIFKTARIDFHFPSTYYLLVKASLNTMLIYFSCTGQKKIPRQKQENFVEVVRFHADLNDDKNLSEKISIYYPFKVQILVQG
jgi:hypothetical protein